MIPLVEAGAWCALGFIWGAALMHWRAERLAARQERIKAYIDGKRETWK